MDMTESRVGQEPIRKHERVWALDETGGFLDLDRAQIIDVLKNPIHYPSITRKETTTFMDAVPETPPNSPTARSS